MVTRKSLSITCAAAVLALVGVTAGDAAITANRTTRLTFNTPIGLPGVTLAAGTYTFELAAPGIEHNIVRVMSPDRSTVYLTAFTRQVTRPAGLRLGRSVAFAETKPGLAPRIATWYPLGESTGHQFVYAR